MPGTDPRMLGTDPVLLVSPTARREGACVYELMEQELIEDQRGTSPRMPDCGVLGSAFGVGGQPSAASGKRQADEFLAKHAELAERPPSLPASLA